MHIAYHTKPASPRTRVSQSRLTVLKYILSEERGIYKEIDGYLKLPDVIADLARDNFEERLITY